MLVDCTVRMERFSDLTLDNCGIYQLKKKKGLRCYGDVYVEIGVIF